MPDKKLTYCPACGAKGSMVYYTDVVETRHPKGWGGWPVNIDGLDGYFCELCDEAVWTEASKQKIEAEVAAHLAKMESRGSSS